MISISISAQQHFACLLNKQKDTHIRIYVNYPGTPIAQVKVSYCHKKDIKQSDRKIEFNNFNVFIDELYIPFLTNAKIDLVQENELKSQLTLVAPNVKKFFMIKDTMLKNSIQKFLDCEVNPQLSMHGGSVVLVGITNSGYASLQFFGGCNGCSMVVSTLKEGIERKLLAKFPKLKGVYDSTKHLYGKHSYS